MVTLSRCFSLERVPSRAILLETRIDLIFQKVRPFSDVFVVARTGIISQAMLFSIPLPSGFCACFKVPTFLPTSCILHFPECLLTTVIVTLFPLISCLSFHIHWCTQTSNACRDLFSPSDLVLLLKRCVHECMYVISHVCMYVCMAICAVISLPVFHEDTQSTVYVAAGFVI